MAHSYKVFLQKPFNDHELLAIIGKLTGQNHQLIRATFIATF